MVTAGPYALGAFLAALVLCTSATTTAVEPDLVNNPVHTAELDLTMRVDRTHALPIVLGLGTDGRVGAEIIDSIHAAHRSN